MDSLAALRYRAAAFDKVNRRMNHAAARANMVESQIRPNGITDARIVAAMAAVPRERFVPEALRGVAYMDEDIVIAPGRTLMEPMAFARLAQLAGVGPTDKVLHVGCGAGYGTAVLARLAGTVIGLEADADLAAAANEALAGDARVHAAEPAKGRVVDGPYDVILIEGRIPDVPASLVLQLKDGGRLVAVVGLDAVAPAMLVTRHGDSQSSRTAFDASVSRLPGFEKSKSSAFVF